ncbi:protein RRP5 homolog [Anneissia japonica]|uniref:protein RRP5 homolog n=1 Tax=Anneissia japonica TaxID=1529436 RepID=UPI0014256116|nr:protein RRP5 homolog [Anneissia japonica]
MMEEDFPRGKVKKKSVKSEAPEHVKPVHHKQSDSKDVLFKDAKLGPEKKKKARKRKSEKKVEDEVSKKQHREDEDSSALLSTKDIIKHLSIRTLTDETLLLGAVREIHDIELVISLPNNLHGYVQITDINDKYTERIREEQQKETKEVESEDDDNNDEQQELPTLHEAFSIGDIVICRVKELVMVKGHSRILLTLNPADITTHLSADNLKESMVLPGSVSSIEDHGFMVDVGISGIKAFLQTKDANQFIHNQNQGKNLFIGQLLQCIIKETKSNGRSLLITINRKSIQKSQAQSETHTTLQSFMPGTRLEATITYVGESYLGAVVHSTFKASIMELHLKDLAQSTSDYRISDTVSACVLFNCPVTKTLGLTLKSEFSDPTAKLKKSLFGGLAIGDFADKAKVRSVKQKRGVLVDLKKDVQGLLMATQVDDKEVTNLEETFKEGQVIKCRITDFNFIDNLALVSMKAATLAERYLHLKDVEPGDRVKGTITAVQENGLQVKISAHIKGFVPRSHLADVPIQNPHKIFSETDKIALRVIHVSPQQNRLILTHKKTLVKSKLNIISDYSQFEEGMYVHGTIVSIKKFGCVVMFCNGVKGLIPRSELANERIEFPEKIFYVGQVVKCRVIKTHEPSMKRVILSLRSDKDRPRREKKVKTEPKVAVGKIMKVTVISATPDGLNVKMETEEEAVIPTMHLSDYTMNCDLILTAASPGDEMEAMMFNNKGPKGQQILTCKPSLIGVSNSGEILKDFSELNPGMEMVGCLRNIMPYGLFVEFLNNLVGLAPLKDISDSYTLDPSKLFAIGQTLHAHVKEVNEEKERFLVSLRPSEVSMDITALDLLRGFLKEQRKILKKLKSAEKHKVLSGMTVGSIVTATLKEIQKGGFLCQLDGNISAVVTRGHCPAQHDHQPGDNVEAVILHVDIPSEVVELSMKQKLVAFAQTLEKKKLGKMDELKVKVELVKECFALASTDEGTLIYLPVKKHYNDVRIGADLLKFGQTCKVKVHGTVAGKPIAEILQKGGSDNNDENRKFIRFGLKEMEEKAEEHGVTRGSIVEAVIHSVKEGQVNVVVKGCIQGRIHVTEIVDEAPLHGKTVLNGFKLKAKLKARVIGYREMKQNKSLILTNQFTQLGLELSIKPSKIKEDYEVPERHVSAKKQLHSFEPGQTVTVFVQQFCSNILWVHVTPYVGGKIHRLNISKKLSVLTEPVRHFKKSGQAIQAKVLGLDDEEKVLQLTMTGEEKKEVKEKSVVNGCVKKVLADRLCIQLPFGCFGSVFITDIRDHFKDRPLEGYKEDQYVRCAVLDAKDRQHVVLSLRPSRISKHNDPGADQEVMTLDDVKEGSVVKGYVSECNEQALFVCLSRTVTGTVKLNQVSSYYVEDFASVFPVGTLVSVKVLRVNKDKEKVSLSMLPKDTELPDAVPEHLRGHFKVSKKESRKRQRKTSANRESDDSGMEENESEDEMVAAAAPRLTLSSGFSWDVDLSKLGQMSKLGAGDDESSSEEEDDVPPQKRAKKEKKNEKKNEEAEIQRTEQALMQEDRTPETAEDFNRLVLSSPNSSMIWIRYMAFHLQNSEAEKARAVAERALETINFREEQEKLNVWVAYLNLENLYGNEETLIKIFERALQQCEPIKVFQQLISIYIRTDKNEAADQLFGTMVKRFRSEKDVWINYGSFLMRNGKQDAAHKLMQRSFKSLESKQHVDVIVKFAQMEFKCGEPERAKTMFDNVLSSYPKRTDIWSVYLDMVIKQGDPVNTRNLFERVISLELQPKKIKFFFKRYLDYEKKFGDEGRVKAVKAKAVGYVEKKSSVLT